MPKSRKTKAKYKDFQKVKLKVGKTLPKADNVTNTSFKSRGIHIKEQLKSSEASGVTTTRRKQGLQDLLAHCHHHNISMRHDAMTGLREIITENPNVLHTHLAPLLERVPDLCIDKDGAVRHATHRFFKAALPHISPTHIAPFFPILSAHLCCAMTHIDDEIQMDSLLLFDLYMEHYPQLVVTSHNDLLTNFIEQISRKSSSAPSSSGGEQKGAGGGSKGGRALLVNPNSKMSSRKGRVQVLDRLHKFLKAVIDQRDPTSSDEITPSNTTFTYKNETASYHQPISSCWSKPNQMHKLNDKIKSAAASGSDILSNGQKLRASLDVLLPLMLQCWVEVGPAQLSTNLPGNVMSRDAMATLANILKVLHLLLKCVEVYDKDADNTIMKSVRETHLNDFVQYYLPFFPYSMHEAPVSSKKKAPKPEPTIPVLTLNLMVCEVMSYFAASVANTTPSWLEKLTDFIGQSSRQTLDHEQLQSLLRFVGKLLEFNLDHDKQEELMVCVCALFSSARGQSLSRNVVLLMRFISDKIMDPSKTHFLSMPCVKKWLAKVPGVLVQSIREDNANTRKVIDISRRLAPLKQEAFSASLAGENCLKLTANMGQLSGELQGALVDLLYWVPVWDRAALQSLAGVIRTGTLLPAHAHKLMLALVYRYERQRTSGEEKLIFDHSDFFNFLLTVIVGYGKQDLRSPQGTDSADPLTPDCSFLQTWTSRVQYIEVVSSVLLLLPNTSQVIELLETAVSQMLEQYRLPLDTIYAFVVVLTRLHKSSGEIIPFSSSAILVKLVRSALRLLTGPEPKQFAETETAQVNRSPPAPGPISWQVARDGTLDACTELLSASSETLTAFVTELLISMEKSSETIGVYRHVLLLNRLYRDSRLRPATACRVHHIRPVMDQLQDNIPDLQSQAWWSDLKYEVSLMQPK